MISIFSILRGVVLFSLASSQVFSADDDGYSLWPRRPEELEAARRLMGEQKYDDAVSLLQPFVQEVGIAGREARQMTGAINVRRYLSRNHPRAQVHLVKRGETLARISAECACPTDLIMLLNGIVEPSDLKAGQKIVVVPMDLRMELRPLQRELSVWDGVQLVASYNVLGAEGFKKDANEETEVSDRPGYIGGVLLPSRSTQFLCSDRGLLLANGISLVSGESGQGRVVKLERKDLNELTLLMGIGSRVSVVYDDSAFQQEVPSSAD